MAGQRVSFEWNTLEDEFSWRRLLSNEGFEPPVSATPAVQSADRWLLIQLARGAAIVFVALISLSGNATSPTELENIRLGNEIQTVLRTEEEARRTGNQALLNQLIDPQPTDGWRRVWRNIPPVTNQDAQEGPVITLVQAKSTGNLVMADVLVDYSAYGWAQFNHYKEFRFYRETDVGWLRTVPDDTFWGTQQVLETELVRFEFRHQERPLVQANAQRLDQLYAKLLDMLALEGGPFSEKLTFALTSELVGSHGSLTIRNEITSPLLAPVPRNLSREEHLTQRIADQMTYLTVNRRISVGHNANRMGGSSYRWRNMQSGLRRWLRMELLSSVSPSDQIAIQVFEAQLADYIPVTLNDISEENLDLLTDRNYRYWHNGATASLVDYMVDTYGEEVLPRLVRGLQSDRRWNELIPYVIDKPADEFEAEWNQFLAQRVQ